MGWFNREAQQREQEAEEKRKKEANANTDDIELKPAEIKAKLNKLDSMEGNLKTSINADLDTKLKPVNDFIASLAKEKADNARKVAAEKKLEQDGDLAEEWLTDPDKATRRVIEPTNNAIKILAARGVKQDVLDNKEYYHGDIKSKVDALISQQPLDSQCNAATVENCYKVILADHITEINEGKLKTRSQAATFDSKGTGAHGGRGSEEADETLTDEEKNVARKFGMSEKEWAAARKEVTYV